MKKKYLKLTKDQKARGVIFSSCLIGDVDELTIHEVLKDQKRDIDEHIKLLKDDKFFDNSPYKYNLIRT